MTRVPAAFAATRLGAGFNALRKIVPNSPKHSNCLDFRNGLSA
jgi:hypothetical protein